MSKVPASFDAVDWAEEFVRIVKERPTIPTDEAAMIGWFANALMRGFDEANRRHATAQADLAELVAAAENDLVDCCDSKIHAQCVRLDAALKPFREEKPR